MTWTSRCMSTVGSATTDSRRTHCPGWHRAALAFLCRKSLSKMRRRRTRRWLSWCLRDKTLRIWLSTASCGALHSLEEPGWCPVRAWRKAKEEQTPKLQPMSSVINEKSSLKSSGNALVTFTSNLQLNRVVLVPQSMEVGHWKHPKGRGQTGNTRLALLLRTCQGLNEREWIWVLQALGSHSSST